MIARRIGSAFGKDKDIRTYTCGATAIVASDTPIVVLSSGLVVACADDATAQLGLIIANAAISGECKVIRGLPGITFEIPVESDDTGGGAPVVGAQYGIEVATDGIQYLNVDETSSKLLNVLAYDSATHIATVSFIASTQIG